MTLIKIVGDTWTSKMVVSRVPCVGEKVRPRIPPNVAGGATRMECIVTDVSHCEREEDLDGFDAIVTVY